MTKEVTKSEVTRDGFQRGRFTLVQPKKGAHRAGLDALLLASVLPKKFSGHVVDLGSGAGAIGLAVAARDPTQNVSVTLIENDTLMVSCAKQGIAAPENAAFASHVTLCEANIVGGASALADAGLMANSVDAVLTNPPYNLRDMQPSQEKSRAKAHQADEALLEKWFRAATGILKPKGFLALIIRPQSLGLILRILENRFGDLCIIPIYAHDDEPAIRMIITGIRGSRAPLHIAPHLVLHDKKTRAYRPHIDELLNGVRSYEDI